MADSRIRTTAFVAALALALSAAMPAAVLTPEPTRPVSRAQTFEASPSVRGSVTERDGYGVRTSPVCWPLESGDADVSSTFGSRDAPTAGASTFHAGIDFGVPTGTPIRSVAAGVVTSAGWAGGLGFAVRVEHTIDGAAVESVYGHMVDVPPVQRGDVVERGQVVGFVDSTGVSTGAHLHIEIHVGGEAIDPLPWLYGHAS